MTPTGRLSTFFFLRNKLQVVVALNGRTGTVCATIYLKMWSFLEKFILLINFSGGSSESGEQSGSPTYLGIVHLCMQIYANSSTWIFRPLRIVSPWTHRMFFVERPNHSQGHVVTFRHFPPNYFAFRKISFFSKIEGMTSRFKANLFKCHS